MMTVRLIAHTPEPEKVVAAAAKLCYSDAHITDLLDGLTEEKTAKFLTMLSDLGHASPIEHASFTFGIEGVSRTLLAQITRHRVLQRSEPALCPLGRFQIRYPAGDRGHPRSEGGLHRQHERGC